MENLMLMGFTLIAFGGIAYALAWYFDKQEQAAGPLEVDWDALHEAEANLDK